jgi:hypothetical protein
MDMQSDKINAKEILIKGHYNKNQNTRKLFDILGDLYKRESGKYIRYIMMAILNEMGYIQKNTIENSEFNESSYFYKLLKKNTNSTTNSIESQSQPQFNIQNSTNMRLGAEQISARQNSIQSLVQKSKKNQKSNSSNSSNIQSSIKKARVTQSNNTPKNTKNILTPNIKQERSNLLRTPNSQKNNTPNSKNTRNISTPLSNNRSYLLRSPTPEYNTYSLFK